MRQIKSWCHDPKSRCREKVVELALIYFNMPNQVSMSRNQVSMLWEIGWTNLEILQYALSKPSLDVAKSNLNVARKGLNYSKYFNLHSQLKSRCRDWERGWTSFEILQCALPNQVSMLQNQVSISWERSWTSLEILQCAKSSLEVAREGMEGPKNKIVHCRTLLWFIVPFFYPMSTT